MQNVPGLNIPESAVVRLWQQQIRRHHVVEDIEGETISVVYPGRPNDGRGGDFRDAVIRSRQGQQKGCIEIHTLTSGWQSHGHHRDPHYNQVVLQVAWKADQGVPARSQNGRTIPTVLLKTLPREPAPDFTSDTGLACRQAGKRPDPGQLTSFLEQSGEERFRLKSRRFREQLLKTESAQVLYEGLVESLGYSQNQKAFLDFAQRVPLAVCPQDGGSAGLPSLSRIQAFLLGQAGLLPSQRGLTPEAGGYALCLEQLWHQNGWQALSPAPNWERYRVRPLNQPVRRLIALSHWLCAGRLEHWQPNYLMPVTVFPKRQSQTKLETNLMVRDPGFWSHFSDFGHALKIPNPVILGTNRIGEIIINVILPFLQAWADVHSMPDLANQSLSMYRGYPGLAANSIQRHMSGQLALTPKLLNSACRQQGLMHIYQTLCTAGRCHQCVLF